MQSRQQPQPPPLRHSAPRFLSPLPGAGGGKGNYNGDRDGGAGGGAIHIAVSGAMVLDGTISVDGGDGVATSSQSG